MIIKYKTNPMNPFVEIIMAVGGTVDALKTLLKLVKGIDVTDMIANIQGESKGDAYILTTDTEVVFMQEGNNAK